MNLFMIFYIIRFSIFAMMYSIKYWFFSLISNYWVRHYHWVIKGSLIIVPFFNFWNIGFFLDLGLSLLRVVFRGMGDPEVRAHPEEGTGAPQDHLSPKISEIKWIYRIRTIFANGFFLLSLNICGKLHLLVQKFLQKGQF